MKTKSEEVFEKFLACNDVRFEKIVEIYEAAAHRPDYLVTLGNLQLVFEIKELSRDDNFGVVNHSRTRGDHIRRAIQGARKQIQYGANKGIPSILLIYNSIDPVFQSFGTEDGDFITAMYGELTLIIDRNTKQASKSFYGKNQSLQELKNTSFSAVGRLSDRGGKATATLFDNVFSKVKIPYENLPPCFDFQRVEVSTDPLSSA